VGHGEINTVGASNRRTDKEKTQVIGMGRQTGTDGRIETRKKCKQRSIEMWVKSNEKENGTTVIKSKTKHSRQDIKPEVILPRGYSRYPVVAGFVNPVVMLRGWRS
jgi:hypothetical protein